MPPRVSVLVNNHNYGRYLEAALQSVLDQDFSAGDVEIIAVDDASTDDSREVLARFAPRVRAVLRAQNGGQAAAFNDGFAAASGDILCLLDSDDWWAPSKLSRVVARFDAEPDLGMVQHWCREIGPGGRPLGGQFPELPPRYDAADFLAGRCVFTGTTGLSFRAEAARRIAPVPEELRIDADSYLYNAILGAPAGNIGEALGFRRVHGANRYAGRMRDPARLAEHRRALAVLDRELERLLAGSGRELAEEPRRRRRAEELLADLFLARYAGDLGRAWGCWKDSLSQYSGARRAAKGASLLLALASPRAYLGLQDVYARLRNG
ncbi:MAG TPA: glycosyltransferase [Elusimicrobiota bacterium]|nr:glycosyltransferase [Elusimicrobiota bacterium]